MKYELWGNDCEYTFMPEDSCQRDLLTEDQVLITIIEAETWQEACFKRNEYLGWKPYRPLCPHCTNSMTYGNKCCEDCGKKE